MTTVQHLTFTELSDDDDLMMWAGLCHLCRTSPQR
jgi:hypothetical protein